MTPPSDVALSVLVVGNDRSDRELLSDVLHTRGHEVVGVGTVRAAQDALANSPFPIVVLDLARPQKENSELCRHIREHEKGEDAFILVVTSESDPDAILETMETEADDYLTKPVDPALFRLRVAMAEREVNRRASHHEERERAAAQEEEVRSLLANLDEVIFSLDPRAGRLLRVSPAARQLLGHSPEDLMADESLWRPLLFPPEVEQRQEELSRIMGGPITHHWQVPPVEGSTRWVEVSVKGTLDESGVLVRVDGRLSDVTEAQRSRSELAARNKELMTLYRISEVTLTASSPEDAYEEILEELCKATEFSIAVIAQCDARRERLTVTAAWGLPPDHSRLDMPIQDTLAGTAFTSGEPVVQFTAPAQRNMADDLLDGLGIQTYLAFPMIINQQVVGTLIMAHTEASERPQRMVRWASSLANGVAQFLDRVTSQSALRVSEQRYRSLSEELQQANQELERFAYSVSHDLRAPLPTMQGFAHAMLQNFGDSLPSEVRDYAQRIIASGRQSEILIRDLLAYSRLSFEDLEVQAVSLTKVVATAREQLDGVLNDAEADLSVEGELPNVLGQMTTLVQVVTNLISNAVTFVSEGERPRIRIRAEERGSWVRLWIEDNGIGIPAGQEERIFRVFERLTEGGTHPGTGIGLAIVRRGMERVGGRAGVETNPSGGGSSFWVDIPRVEGTPSRTWKPKKS